MHLAAVPTRGSAVWGGQAQTYGTVRANSTEGGQATVSPSTVQAQPGRMEALRQHMQGSSHSMAQQVQAQQLQAQQLQAQQLQEMQQYQQQLMMAQMSQGVGGVQSHGQQMAAPSRWPMLQQAQHAAQVQYSMGGAYFAQQAAAAPAHWQPPAATAPAAAASAGEQHAYAKRDQGASSIEPPRAHSAFEQQGSGAQPGMMAVRMSDGSLQMVHMAPSSLACAGDPRSELQLPYLMQQRSTHDTAQAADALTLLTNNTCAPASPPARPAPAPHAH